MPNRRIIRRKIRSSDYAITEMPELTTREPRAITTSADRSISNITSTCCHVYGRPCSRISVRVTGRVCGHVVMCMVGHIVGRSCV